MGFRYIGSKDKLSETIISEIQLINKDATRIIDLMAGTGLFSLALREAGYQVIANDVMTYSYHHLKVHLCLNAAPSFNGIEGLNLTKSVEGNYQKLLTYLNNLTPVEGYFYKEFCPDGIPSNTTKKRKYFSTNNAIKIDAIRNEIKRLKSENIISDIEHSLLLHDLIMSANDVANIAGTYGHYLSKFTKRAEDDIMLHPSVFSNVGDVEGHEVYKGYAEENAHLFYGDICYIDPPYIKRQYAANYHILETLAREDEPEAIGDSGLRPWRDQYSNFCSKMKIRESLKKIIISVNCNDILISYSEDGLLPINDLVDFLSQFGTVTKKDIEYKRFKSNNSVKKATLNEFLIHLRKK